MNRLRESHAAAVTAAVTRPADARSQVITDADTLARHAPEWRALAAHSGPTEQFGWAAACAGTLAAPDAWQVFTVRERGELTAVAPMVRIRRFGIDHLAMLGVDALYEPMDLPCRNAGAARRLLDMLLSPGTPLLLQRLPSGSRLLQALAECSGWRVQSSRQPAPAAPFITLDGRWLEPESQLNPRRRADLRRAARRAAAHGPLRIDIHAPTPADFEPLFAHAIAVEARSWKGRDGTALLHDDRRRAFFRRYAELAAADGQLRIALLWLGEQVAATQIAAVAGGRYAVLKIGYDDTFAACSPGLLLLQHTVRHAAQCGLQRYEFLGLPEDWIAPWTRERHECCCLRLYPSGVRGTLALATAVAGGTLRRTPLMRHSFR